MPHRMRNVHPGEILKMELVEGRKLSVSKIAELLDYDIRDIYNVLNGHAKIPPPMALKLQEMFGGSSENFLRLQAIYDQNNSKN